MAEKIGTRNTHVDGDDVCHGCKSREPCANLCGKVCMANLLRLENRKKREEHKSFVSLAPSDDIRDR